MNAIPKKTAAFRPPAGRSLKLVVMLVTALILLSPVEAAPIQRNAPIPAIQIPPPVIAGKFSFLDDILGGINRSGGRYVGPIYGHAQREERRGKRGFFHYLLQGMLRFISGCFLAYHAGKFIERISSKKDEGLVAVVGIGGFVFSLIFPWIGMFIGVGCMGLDHLAKESSKTPPAA